MNELREFLRTQHPEWGEEQVDAAARGYIEAHGSEQDALSYLQSNLADAPRGMARGANAIVGALKDFVAPDEVFPGQQAAAEERRDMLLDKIIPFERSGPGGTSWRLDLGEGEMEGALRGEPEPEGMIFPEGTPGVLSDQPYPRVEGDASMAPTPPSVLEAEAGVEEAPAQPVFPDAISVGGDIEGRVGEYDRAKAERAGRAGLVLSDLGPVEKQLYAAAGGFLEPLTDELLPEYFPSRIITNQEDYSQHPIEGAEGTGLARIGGNIGQFLLTRKLALGALNRAVPAANAAAGPNKASRLSKMMTGVGPKPEAAREFAGELPVAAMWMAGADTPGERALGAIAPGIGAAAGAWSGRAARRALDAIDQVRPGAVVVLPDGRTIPGRSHLDLISKLTDEGIPLDDAMMAYRTKSGGLVTEGTAMDIARRSGQLRGAGANRPNSANLQEAITDTRTNPERMADEAIAALQEKGEDGFTVNAIAGDVMERPDLGPPGTSVARTHVGAEITDANDPQLREKLVKWIEENDHYLLDNPNKYDLGGWIDDGKFYVEIAERMGTDEAVRAGQRANQVGIFKVDKGMKNRAMRESWKENRSTEFVGEMDDPFMGLGEAREFRWDTPVGEVQALIAKPTGDADLAEVKWIGPIFDQGEDFTGKLGAQSMMEIQGDLLRAFPEVDEYMFTRVSGARNGPAADLSSRFQHMIQGGQLEVDKVSPAMRRMAERGAPPVPDDAFVPTGGTGEPMHPAQVLLREFDIAGPGTRGVGRMLAGSLFGATGGYMAGDTPEERATLALYGAMGGGIMAGLASPANLRKAASHIKTDRGGYVYLPGLAKRVDGAVAHDPDALIRTASSEELSRLTRDRRSYGTMLHHSYGHPLKPIPEEDLAKVSPTRWDNEARVRVPSSGRLGGSPLTGEARRGVKARPGMPRDEFVERIMRKFPDMTPEEAATEHAKSMKDYHKLLQDNVIAMENMADWDDLLTYFHAGNFLLDGQRPWYMGVRETVESFLGPDMGEMFIRFLAATSARASAVGEHRAGNIGLAKKAFIQWLKGADEIRPRGNFGATSLDQAETIMARVFSATEITTSPSGGTGARVVFGGRKLDNYYRALMGDPDAVVVDVWMARLFGFDPDQKGLSKAQFDFIERHVREIASEFDMRPVDVQSAMWQGIKAHWTELGRTPNEIIENYARTLERSLGKDPGFIDIAAGRWNSDAAQATAKELKELLPKAMSGDEAAELMAMNRSYRLGQQLGIGHTDLMRAFVRTGAGGLIGGAVGGATTGSPEGAAAGFVAGAAMGFGARRAFGSLKEAASAYRAKRTLRAQVAQDYAEAVTKRTGGAIDAPTSGYHVNEPIDLEEFMGKIDVMNLRESTEQVMETRAARIIRERGLPDQAQRSRSRATTRRLARDMDIDLGKMNPKKMDDVEALALRNEINVTTERLRDIENILNSGGFHTAEELEKLYQIDDALEQRLGDLLEFFNQTRSQFGRNLNSLKYLADRYGNVPTFWYARAQKTVGDGILTTEMRQTIDKLIAEGDTPALIQYINSLRRLGAPEKANTLWKVGLLTSPTTHMANGIGNMAMMGLEGSKDAPAVMFDRLLTLATGQRSKGSAFAGLRSLRKGTVSGTRGAKETFTEGIIPQRLYGKYDLNFGEVTFDNPIIDLYSKAVFRGLLAGDAFFRAQALERSFVDLAEVYAKNAGLKGSAKRARVRELLVDPTDEMVSIAIHEAEVATFMNDPSVSVIMQGVTERAKRMGNETSRRFVKQAFDYTVPFKRTPTNVIERAFEYSPIGPLARISDARKLWKLVAEESSDPEELLRVQRRIANTLGRSTVGSFPILMGYYLASTGKLRTSWPDDQKESTAWQMTGEQENSLLIGEDWYKLDRISPIGNLIILGGHAYENLSRNAEPKDDESEPGPTLANGLAVIGGGVRSLTEQTFLRNLSENLSALMGEGRGGSAAQRIINNYARSLVPAIVRRGVVGYDAQYREAETAGESFQSAILPGGSEALGIDPLPVKRDVFGEERERRDAGWAYLLNPFARKKDKTQTDETVRVLDRLGVTPSFRSPMPGESDVMFKRRVEREGQTIRELVHQLETANPQVRVRENPGDEWVYVPWADLTDEYQADVLTRGISNIRRTISQAFKRGYLSEATQNSGPRQSRERR